MRDAHTHRAHFQNDPANKKDNTYFKQAFTNLDYGCNNVLPCIEKGCQNLKLKLPCWSKQTHKHTNSYRFLHAFLRNTRHQAYSLPRMFKCSISQNRLKYFYDTETGPVIWNLAYSIHLFLEDVETKLLSGKAEATIPSYLFRRAFIRTNMKTVWIHLWLK